MPTSVSINHPCTAKSKNLSNIVGACLNWLEKTTQATAKAVCAIAKKFFELLEWAISWVGSPFIVGFVCGIVFPIVGDGCDYLGMGFLELFRS